jgi:hypothetical protein
LDTAYTHSHHLRMELYELARTLAK